MSHLPCARWVRRVAKTIQRSLRLRNMGNEKKSVKDITYLLPVYCRVKNDEAIKEVRHAFLEENGINMKLYTAGYYDTDKGRESLTEREAKVIEMSKFIKIDLLTHHYWSREWCQR